MSNITVGADPEFFLEDIHTGKIISAVGKVEGDKEHPKKISEGFIQRDNILAELNIFPATNSQSFWHHTKSLIMEADMYIQSKYPNLRLSRNIASSYIEESELTEQEAFIFGCAKDYDCWQIDTIERINPYEIGAFRSCGGHIHIELKDITSDTILQTGRACDLTIGLPSVLYDEDKNRRKIYGQASRFRPKPYGIEYRTPSNFWTKDGKKAKWIYEAAVSAARHFSFYLKKIKNEKDILTIKKTINTSDVEHAIHLLNKYGILIEQDLLTKESKEIIKKIGVSELNIPAPRINWPRYSPLHADYIDSDDGN